jgi:hypothetical protein
MQSLSPRAERFIKKTGSIKLVSLEEAVDRFKEHHSTSFIVIHIHWTRENIETVLWYVKLR